MTLFFAIRDPFFVNSGQFNHWSLEFRELRQNNHQAMRSKAQHFKISIRNSTNFSLYSGPIFFNSGPILTLVPRNFVIFLKYAHLKGK